MRNDGARRLRGSLHLSVIRESTDPQLVDAGFGLCRLLYVRLERWRGMGENKGSGGGGGGARGSF
jgi:hypothetical protein